MARTLKQPVPSDALREQLQLIAALRNPQCYPHPAKTVRLIETHISWILLAGRYAYKIKKAVDLGFIDATRLVARHDFCHEEIRLNRRLAPHLYLDAIAIGGSPAQPELGTLPAIEYAVKMRRFAPSKTLDHLVARKKVTPVHIDALASSLAEFHSSLPATANDSGTAFSANLRTALAQNFSQLAGLQPGLSHNEFAALQRTCADVFAQCKARIEQRCADGFVRECHGDLHLGNIALIGDRPTPFDGIDFNPALRWIDVMDEISFLFMDLLHQRHPQLAYRLLDTYLAHTGDYAGLSLLPLYSAYRATVRAKVSAIRANQEGVSPRGKLAASRACRAYLTLANECLEQRHPKLLITHGLPGSGKSTFAQLALARLGAIRLRSDVERKRLFGLTALEKSRSGQDIYSAEATRRTYAHLRNTAHGLLRAGYTVIVDAAFLKHEEREAFRELADKTDAAFVIASMHADTALLRARIRQRQTRADDASEADLAVLERLRTAQEPLTSQETRYTATFVYQNESDPAWQTLEELLHIGSTRR